MDNKLPFVSIIIPTYHDWDRLTLCIDALKRQSYPSKSFEVIIVSNDPEDTVPQLALPENFTCITEAKPGSYAARNRGIIAARGEILAFTDSDCIPYTDWLEQAVNVLMHGVDRVAGKIELFYRSDKLTPAEIFEKAFAFKQEENASTGASVTANMITWKINFENVGLFDDSLMSGGDMEWGWRANDKGITINYSPSVVVRHPARHTIKSLLAKRKRVVGRSITGNVYMGEGFLCIFRGWAPPVRGFLKLKKGLSIYEKITAAIILYYLKIYGTYQKTCFLNRLKKPISK